MFTRPRPTSAPPAGANEKRAKGNSSLFRDFDFSNSARLRDVAFACLRTFVDFDLVRLSVRLRGYETGKDDCLLDTLLRSAFEVKIH